MLGDELCGNRPPGFIIYLVCRASLPKGRGELRACATANRIRAEEFNNHVYEIC